jgi:hypothetical protein
MPSAAEDLLLKTAGILQALNSCGMKQSWVVFVAFPGLKIETRGTPKYASELKAMKPGRPR